MSPADAIAYAGKVKASWPPEKLNNAPKVARALIAMLELCERTPAQHPRFATKPRKDHRTARQPLPNRNPAPINSTFSTYDTTSTTNRHCGGVPSTNGTTPNEN